MSIFEFYPKYSSFKESFKYCEKPTPTWKIILFYPLALLGIFLLSVTVVGVVNIISISQRLKYPSYKYKKVVRKGVLWDTTEYHEK